MKLLLQQVFAFLLAARVEVSLRVLVEVVVDGRHLALLLDGDLVI